ncbi:MAG: polysaccharide deacetylase family protein [Acidobacteria bacterium]|nr:polysaccharide deacetylase family protein [Acidobacteriota bacterium]
MNPFATAALGLSATALLAGGALYAGMWPTSQIYGHTWIAGDDPSEVALTYDDGPSPDNTPALLELLAQHNVHATFFLIGEHVRRYPQLARRIAEEGHSIGNHTMTHPNLFRSSSATTHRELADCQRLIADTTGVTPRLFRPPFGARNPATLRVARAMHLEPVMWNVTAKDWQPLSVEAIIANIDRDVGRNQRKGRGSNILLHDASHLDTPQKLASRANTLAATAELLMRPGLRFIAL